METVYIPAGRSMITLLSDQLPVLFTDPNRQLPALDYCTNAYIHGILSLRQSFANGLEGLLKQEIETTDKHLNLPVLKHMMQLTEKILKARYCYRASEEQLLLDVDETVKSIKVNFASSGQQETVWALNLLFYYLLEDKPSCIILEEPEAHLYPDSQKYMAEALGTFANVGTVVHSTWKYFLWTLPFWIVFLLESKEFRPDIFDGALSLALIAIFLSIVPQLNTQYRVDGYFGKPTLLGTELAIIVPVIIIIAVYRFKQKILWDV